MASIGEIKELARQLGLYNIAKGYIDLADEKLSNLDYIASVLQGEVQMREQTALVKREKTSRLPHKVFIKEKVGLKRSTGLTRSKTLLSSANAVAERHRLRRTLENLRLRAEKKSPMQR